MVKYFLWCFGESQGVTIAFFDCIGRCVGTAPPTPRFAASTCGWRTLALGGFHRSALPSLRRLPLGGLTLPLGGLAFGFAASAFRHAPLRGCRSSGWPSGSPLPLFGMHRFGVALGGLAFGLTTSAFRHAPLRGCPRRVGSAAFRFGVCRSSGWCFRRAGWPSGSRLPLFGMRRSAPSCCRREGRRSTPTRHLFHFKTLIPTC